MLTCRMHGLTFQCIWGEEAPDVRADACKVWQRYGALVSESDLEPRSKEIVFVVRDINQEIVALSTARSIKARFLNNHFFYEFRCFIAPGFRVPGLDSALALKTKMLLQDREEPGGQHKGLIMIIEHPELKARRTKAVWSATGMVFAGYTPQGHHVRVGYFDGARI